MWIGYVKGKIVFSSIISLLGLKTSQAIQMTSKSALCPLSPTASTSSQSSRQFLLIDHPLAQTHGHTRAHIQHTPGDLDPDTHTAPALKRTNRGPGLPARAPAPRLPARAPAPRLPAQAPAPRLGAVQPPGACPPACQCSRTGNRAWSPR